MGIIKQDDVIAWKDGQNIYCYKCGDELYDLCGDDDFKPLVEGYFELTDIVICDECGERIQ